MTSMASGVLLLIAALMLLAAAVFTERDRRRTTKPIPLLLAPMNVLMGVGFAVQGLVSLFGGDIYSWPGVVGTPLIAAGGVGAFVVSVIGRRRQRNHR